MNIVKINIWEKALLVLVLFTIIVYLLSDETFDIYLLDEESQLTDIDYYDRVYPLPINKASYEELLLITDLTDTQIQAIIEFRQENSINSKQDLYEIGFDKSIVQKIINYISFSEEKSLVFRQRLRYYQLTDEKSTSNRLFQSTELSNKSIRIGYISTSDTLHTFLTANNSYYLHFTSMGFLNQLNIGKYRLSLGQGIAYAPYFGLSKTSAVITHPIKNYNPLRAHTSPYNNWSLGGVAAVMKMGNTFFIPFYSSTRIHARIEDDKIRTIYPYGEPGYEHRKTVTEEILGLALQYSINNNNYGFYFSGNSFDREFLLAERNNKYRTVGVFFRQSFENLSLFGEYTDIDKKNGFIFGIRWGRSPFRQLLLYRKYDSNLPVWHGNPFSSANTFDNETGIYYGLEIKPFKRMTINSYFDIWKFPDTSYFEKMPVTRSEQFIQIHYNLPFDRLRLRMRRKDYDKYRVVDDEGKIRREISFVCGFDWTHNIEDKITLRSGIEFIERYIPETKTYNKGLLLYENVRWRLNKFVISGQINAFNSGIPHYNYEYTLQGMWESKPFSGDDIYTWLMVKMFLTSNITVEIKSAWFYSKKYYNTISQVSYQY